MPTDDPDENIQQLTDLVDYVGSEIYEGDILRETAADKSRKNTGVCKSIAGGWRIFSLRGIPFHT